jgi:hypothetical protein
MEKKKAILTQSTICGLTPAQVGKMLYDDAQSAIEACIAKGMTREEACKAVANALNDQSFWSGVNQSPLGSNSKDQPAGEKS